jgi:hypothetical protein
MGWHSHPDQPQPDTLNDNVVTEARENPTREVQHQARSNNPVGLFHRTVSEGDRFSRGPIRHQ